MDKMDNSPLTLSPASQDDVHHETDIDGVTPSPSYSYDEVFPALPECQMNSLPQDEGTTGDWSNKMRVGTSVITHVFHVPSGELRFASGKFGNEKEALYKCSDIMRDSGAHIELSQSSKDHSMSFVINGKKDAVEKARRSILMQFQTQATATVVIPKEHHRHILGKSASKLQELERMTATHITVPKSDDPSENISVIGSREGIERALHEIRVISDEQSKQSYERLEIPKAFHPFVAGPQNERVLRLQYEGVHMNVPPPSVQKDEITLAGEREAVAKAKEEVMGIFHQMESRCATVPVEVRKPQHRFVIGPKGSSIAEILRETGVSVEVPPSDSTSETITLRGPPEKLGTALNLVYAKANSVTCVDVIAPAWLHKYIIGKKGTNINAITAQLPKVHIEFTEREERIRLEGPPEDVITAQNSLQQMIQKLLESLTSSSIEVESRFRKYVIGKGGANVNRIKDECGVSIVVPETDGGVVRVEGSQAGVTKAMQELTELVHKLENEMEKDITIEQRFHKEIIGAKGERIKGIREKFNQVQIIFPDIGDKCDTVRLRGPKAEVETSLIYLTKVVKELQEQSFQAQVPIYKQFHKFIIGKGGVNIKKIRDETNTKIELPAEGSESDTIIITGKKEAVEEARTRILKIQSELSNVQQVDVFLPCKLHNVLIGAGGRLIQTIMEDCGGVSIKFPPSDSRSDKVTIRGPKEDVEKAKRTLLNLSNEKEALSHSAQVHARSQHHGFLIGRQGTNVRRIQETTGARIVFPGETDEDRDIITVLGTKIAVAAAKEELEQAVSRLELVVEKEMRVDPRHHRHFVARRGDILRQIAEQFGGVAVSFPRAGIASDRVILKGAEECVELAQKRIQEIVEDLEQQVTLEVSIPQKIHRTLMGARGHRVQTITAQFGVQIKFPDKAVEGEVNGDKEVQEGETDIESPARDIIRITGRDESCKGAQQALLDLVPITKDVQVPFGLHRFIIGQKGREVRELMDRYDVSISVPPAELYEDVIKVTGIPANVAEASAALEQRVDELQKEREDRAARSFEVSVMVEPKYHPKIIGRKGLVVSKIREEFCVQIQFPKKDAVGDAEQNIVIIGYQDSAEAARDAILKIVNDINDQCEKELHIDPRVHSRLIGIRGRSIKKIMDQFKVDIKFPRNTESEQNVVVVAGSEENVQEAEDHLLLLEEEYLQDMRDDELMEHYTRAPSRSPGAVKSKPSSGAAEKGFVVKGGPWEQRAPDTASSEDFPSFGGMETTGGNSGPIAWGPRR